MRLAPLPLAAALALFGFASNAAAEPGPDAPPPATPDETHAFSIGLRIGAGGAITSRPDDQPGDLTLLYGTGFTGTTGTVAPRFAWAPLPWLALRADLGVAWTHTLGWAEWNEYRRELETTHWSIELPIGADFRRDLGTVALRGGIDLGPRIGLAADVREKTFGFRDDTPPLNAATTTDLVVGLEAGIAIDLGTVRLPIGARYTWNATHPGDTAGRTTGSDADGRPTSLVVETDHTWQVVTGVEFPF